MRKFLSGIAIAAASLLIAMPASAIVLDDFNRSDSATLGADWTQVAGSSSVTNGEASGTNLSLATFNGGSGNTVSFDISSGGTNTTQYIAAVIGYGSGLNYFVKVQGNGGSSLFDHYGFYTGNNTTNSSFAGLSGAFDSAHVVVSVLNSVATLTITPNVGATQVYSYDYGVDFTGGAIGLGFYGNARADNFGNGDSGNNVPEPATVALLGLGLLGFAASRRKAAKK